MYLIGLVGDTVYDNETFTMQYVNYFFICRYYQFLYFTNEDGMSKVYVTPECLMGFYVGIMAPKHAYFKEPLQKTVEYLQRGNLINRWWNEMLENDKREKKREIEDFASQAKDPRALKLIHLSSAFLLLLIGVSLAIIVFSLEFFSPKILEKRLRRNQNQSSIR